MRHLIIFLIFILTCLIADNAMGQTIGKTKTESYQADFEKRKKANNWPADSKTRYWCEKGRFKK